MWLLLQNYFLGGVKDQSRDVMFTLMLQVAADKAAIQRVKVPPR
jgi:hypothetical protein